MPALVKKFSRPFLRSFEPASDLRSFRSERKQTLARSGGEIASRTRPNELGRHDRRDPSLRALIRLALAEDLGRAGDLTTRCFIPAEAELRGEIVAKQPGVVCGMCVAEEVFRTVSRKIRFLPLVRDGVRVRPDRVLAKVAGPREILTAERTALNFLQRMSGVATLTRAFADRLRGTRARLLDTRKTLPGWRTLDKYAVRCGGGANHRLGLYDMVMLKDNHLEIITQQWITQQQRISPGKGRRSRGNRARAAAPLAVDPVRIYSRRLRDFRRRHPKVPMLMEAKTRRQVDLAMDLGADIVLLDNMNGSRLRQEVRRIRARAPGVKIEVSGGVTLKNIRSAADIGVDRISVGRLTHSAPALDMSLEVRL